MKKKILVTVFVCSLFLNLLIVLFGLIEFKKRSIPVFDAPKLVWEKVLRTFSGEKNKINRSMWLDPDEYFPIGNNNYSIYEKRKITIGNETRNAFIVNTPFEMKDTIEVPFNADKIEFGIALINNDVSNEVPKNIYNIILSININKNSVNYKINPFHVSFNKWYDIELDVSDYNDKSVLFELNGFNRSNDDKNSPKIAISYFTLNRKSLGPNDSEYPNVILISLDTLRPDHLGCYGYDKDTSPNIDNLAALDNSLIFSNVISQSNWTLPSHVSMLTSLYVSSHHIYMDRVLDDSILTISEILRDNGYRTAAFTTHIRVSPKYGIGKGFDTFWFEEHEPNLKATANIVIEKATDFIKSHINQKFFLFLHIFDIHSPYFPPSPFDTEFDPNYKGFIIGTEDDCKKFKGKSIDDITESSPFPNLKDLEYIKSLYDGEIKWTDIHIGRLLKELRSLELLDKTLLILTSDHGEEFLEHGGMFHNSLYESVIRVPLIVYLPKTYKVDKKRIDIPIEGSICIAPTILDVLNLKIPGQFMGTSLFASMAQSKSHEASGAYLPTQFSERLCDWDLYKYQLAIRECPWKLIYTTEFEIKNFSNFQANKEIVELYNLDEDKKERYNLSGKRHSMLYAMNNKATGFINKAIVYRSQFSSEEQITLTNEEKDKLMALGYINPK